MRTTRVQKYKKIRHKKIIRILVFALLIPCSILVAGYVISTVIILPSITR